MALSAAVSVALALAMTGSPERLLLCRPQLLGDPALARGEVVPEAARQLGPRFLDYGVPCQDAGEGARAARRAGLDHAIVATAEGRPEGSRFALRLTEAGTDRIRAQRTVDVQPGEDATRPVRRALGDLADALPEGPGPRPRDVAAYSVAGVGLAALAVGAVLAHQASAADERAGRADDPGAYTRAQRDARDRRKWSAISLGAGGAALAAGLTWRFVF